MEEAKQQFIQREGIIELLDIYDFWKACFTQTILLLKKQISKLIRNIFNSNYKSAINEVEQ